MNDNKRRSEGESRRRVSRRAVAAVGTIENHNISLTVNGKPRELISRLEGRVLELAAESQMNARSVAVADPDVEDVHAFGDRLHLRVRESAGTMARLPGALSAAGVRLIHLRSVSPTLEDVFIQLLEQERNGS